MNKVCYCDVCGKDVAFNTQERMRQGKIKGVVFTYSETLCTCVHCGNIVDEPSIGQEDLRRYYDAYKKAAGLLTSEEIIAFRERYGLSAENLAKILRLGAKTITRYENGAIQSGGTDLLLRLAMEGDRIVDLACEAGVSLRNKTSR